jgi:hypothetical protein
MNKVLLLSFLTGCPIGFEFACMYSIYKFIIHVQSDRQTW